MRVVQLVNTGTHYPINLMLGKIFLEIAASTHGMLSAQKMLNEHASTTSIQNVQSHGMAGVSVSNKLSDFKFSAFVMENEERKTQSNWNKRNGQRLPSVMRPPIDQHTHTHTADFNHFDRQLRTTRRDLNLKISQQANAAKFKIIQCDLNREFDWPID